MRSWRIGGLLTFGGLWSISGRFALLNVAINVDQGHVIAGAVSLKWIEWARWTPLFIALILLLNQRGIKRWMTLLVGMLCTWTASPRSGFFLDHLQIGKPTDEAPLGRPDIGVSTNTADPNSPDFSVELDGQGTTLLSGIPWHCSREVRPKWRSMRRAMAAIRLNANDTMMALKPHWSELLNRGVGRLTFVGKSDAKTSGPLSQHITYPAVHFFLDPHPAEAVEGIIDNGEVKWIDQAPEQNEACAIWVSDDTKLQSLFDIGQQWTRPNTNCGDRLFLIRGDRPETGKWSAPIPCPAQFSSDMASEDKTE